MKCFFRSVVTAAAIAFSISVHAQTPNTTVSVVIRTVAAVSLFALLSILSLPVFAQDKGVNNIIDHLTQRVKTAPTAQERGERAKDLSEYASKLQVPTIALVDTSAIDKIAEVLQDQSEIVRLCAAGSLMYLGPQARRAIPALRAALDKEKKNDCRDDCPLIKIYPSQSVDSYIEQAILFIENEEPYNKWVQQRDESKHKVDR